MPPVPNRLSLAALRAGFVAASVLLPNVALYGVAFGMMAGAVGLSLPEAALFSGWVYAGGAQMASLQGWDYPVPLLFVCLTTLAINARYLLMGATLRPWFAGRPPAQVYGSLFFLADGNWLLAMRQPREGSDGVSFFFGSGLAMWIVWVASTAAGHVFGQTLADPRAFGVDFILAAFFAASAVGLWSRAKDVSPLVVAVVVAVIVEALLPGPWYILLGALAGSLAGALRHGRAA